MYLTSFMKHCKNSCKKDEAYYFLRKDSIGPSNHGTVLCWQTGQMLSRNLNLLLLFCLFWSLSWMTDVQRKAERQSIALAVAMPWWQIASIWRFSMGSKSEQQQRDFWPLWAEWSRQSSLGLKYRSLCPHETFRLFRLTSWVWLQVPSTQSELVHGWGITGFWNRPTVLLWFSLSDWEPPTLLWEQHVSRLLCFPLHRIHSKDLDFFPTSCSWEITFLMMIVRSYVPKSTLSQGSSKKVLLSSVIRHLTVKRNYHMTLEIITG